MNVQKWHRSYFVRKCPKLSNVLSQQLPIVIAVFFSYPVASLASYWIASLASYWQSDLPVASLASGRFSILKNAYSHTLAS